MPERQNVLLDPDRRYAFVYVPKVASSSLLATLYAEQVERDPSLDPKPLRTDNRKIHSVASGTLAELSAMGDAKPYTFAVVRNPYARLLSAYRSKIGMARPKTRQRFKGYFDLGEDESFEAVVRRIGEWPEDRRLNWHFAPQSDVLQLGRIDYDEIMKMEDLPGAFEKVTRRVIGRPLELRYYDVRPTGAGDRTLEAYDPELLAIVNDVFAADFENFGYEVASAE